MADRADRGVGGATRWWASPAVWALGLWIVGIIVARGVHLAMARPAALLALASLAAALASARLGRSRVTTLGATGAALVLASMAWWSMHYVGSPESAIRLGGPSRLARFEGVIVEGVYVQTTTAGALGRFDYRSPRTLFMVRAEREIGTAGVRELSGIGPRLLIVDSPSYDGRVATGDRVRVTGWLSAPRRPLNLAEADRAVWMRDRGIVGRLTLKARGHCELIASDGSGGGVGAWLASKRRDLTAGASWALRRAGPADRDEQTTALLASLLLGESRGEMGELGEAFRRMGLNHLLAISGLHLSILAAGVWFVAMTATGRPGLAAGATLASIALYVLVVPPQVPVLRAGIMTAVAAAALTWGRRPHAVSSLALAALVLLVWRPGDVFSAGFQLSFLIVAALVLFVSPLAERMRGAPLQEIDPTPASILYCRSIDCLAVSLVAWCFATPLAAYHFQLITPMAIPMGLLVLPAVAALLWLGFAAIIVTAIAPSWGEPLGSALWAIGDSAAWAVRFAADLPRSSWPVAPPSAAWAVVCLGVVAAMFGGAFTRRRVLGAACIALCVAWLAAPALRARLAPDRDALQLTMFAVGDGSAYLLRSRGRTMMFDCGSGNYLDIATASVGPALRAMGVTRIDTLVLSHGDLDHFSGAAELMKDFGVRRLVVPQALLDEWTHRPDQAAAVVIDRAHALGVRVDVAVAGWTDTLGDARVEALWPPQGRTFERSNDGSLVLRVSAAGRRVLLCGDVQQAAMTAMLATDVDLRADVLELPHHGSFVEAAPAWVRRVGASIVLQSTGLARLRDDKWAGRLDDRTRHVTALHGMTNVRIAADGSLDSSRFVPDPVPITALGDDPLEP